jgi:hypothetical protein
MGNSLISFIFQGYYGYNGDSYHNSLYKPFGKPYVSGDIVGVKVDFSLKTIEFFLNGISQGVAYTNVTGPVSPAVSFYDFYDEVVFNPLAVLPVSVGISSVSSGLSFSQGKSILLSNNNLTIKLGEASDQTRTVATNQVYTSGVHYAEFKIVNTVTPSSLMFGVMDTSMGSSDQLYLSHTGYGMGYKADGTYHLQSNVTNSAVPKFGISDTVGVLLDLTKQNVSFYLNQSLIGVAFTSVTGPISFAATLSSVSDEVTLNPNATIPDQNSTGTQSLGNQNLPKKTEEHFNLFTTVPGLKLMKNNLGLQNTNTVSGFKTVFGSSEWTVNRHYWEIKIINTQTPSSIMIGVSDKSVLTNINNQLSTSAYGWGFSGDGKLYNNSISKPYGKGFVKNDIVGVYLDLEEKTLQFFVNRRCIGVAYTGVTGPVSPAFTLYHPNDEVEVNTYAKLPLDYGFVEDAPGIDVPEGFMNAKLNQSSPQIIYSQPITRRGRSHFDIKIKKMKSQMGIGMSDKVVYSKAHEVKEFKFENLTMFSPLNVEDGKKITQKQNSTNTVISKTKMTQQTLSYVEFKILSCQGNDMVIFGLSPHFKEITPSGSIQNSQFNWIGCSKGEYAFSRDGQYFVDGIAKFEFKGDKEKTFETGDIIGLSLTEGSINLFKNGKLSNSIEIPISDLPFYPALTLFGEKASIEVQEVEISQIEHKDISSHLWLYNSSGKTSKTEEIAEFGPEFKEGDHIGLTYDCDTSSVDYFLNGNHVGLAFENLTESNPMLAVYLFDQDDEIELSLEENEPPFVKTSINQWVKNVLKYSSDDASYPHTNIIGPSNTYPK